MTHELKMWPKHFEAVARGDKKAEIRKNDRDYRVGDVLHLREWVPPYAPLKESLTGLVKFVAGEEGVYTGHELYTPITHVLHGGGFGIESGTCVLSLGPVVLTNLKR